MSNGAYAYGVFLGNMQRAAGEMFRQISAGMQAALTPTSQLTPEQVERRRERQYQRRIAAERKAGLRHVRNEADKIRRDWGLPR